MCPVRGWFAARVLAIGHCVQSVVAKRRRTGQPRLERPGIDVCQVEPRIEPTGEVFDEIQLDGISLYNATCAAI